MQLKKNAVPLIFNVNANNSINLNVNQDVDINVQEFPSQLSPQEKELIFQKIVNNINNFHNKERWTKFYQDYPKLLVFNEFKEFRSPQAIPIINRSVNIWTIYYILQTIRLANIFYNS